MTEVARDAHNEATKRSVDKKGQVLRKNYSQDR